MPGQSSQTAAARQVLSPIPVAPMFAQINHVAIISHQYNTLGKFYEAVFGLKSAAKGRPASAITIGDGYVGLNLIPPRDAYVEGTDHFAMVVDAVEPSLQ